MAYFYLCIAFLLNASANVILKIASGKDDYLLALFGVLFFGINLLFYFLALKTLPLSTSYPIMVVMSFIIINFSSVFYFGEKISPIQVFGFLLIIAGITFVLRFSPSNPA